MPRQPTANHIPGPTPTRGRRRASGAGFSLVEVVIAISLLGIIVIAMIDAVATSVSLSSTSRAASQVETAVVNAADRINRAPVGCDYLVYAQAAVQTQGWPASHATLTQEYLVPGPTPDAPPTWLTGSATAPACPGPEAPDLLVQRVTITVRSPEAELARTIEVVKSDV